jgi:thiamine biosynthesis lipoprotein ApbE
MLQPSHWRPYWRLSWLTAQPGVPVPASPILYEAVRFALLVAEESGGAFLLDPDLRTILLRRHLTLDLGAVAKVSRRVE